MVAQLTKKTCKYLTPYLSQTNIPKFLLPKKEQQKTTCAQICADLLSQQSWWIPHLMQQ